MISFASASVKVKKGVMADEMIMLNTYWQNQQKLAEVDNNVQENCENGVFLSIFSMPFDVLRDYDLTVYKMASLDIFDNPFQVQLLLILRIESTWSSFDFARKKG